MTNVFACTRVQKGQTERTSHNGCSPDKFDEQRHKQTRSLFSHRPNRGSPVIILGTSRNSAAAARRLGLSTSTAFRCKATRDDDGGGGGGLVLRPRCSHCCFLVSAPEKGGIYRPHANVNPICYQVLQQYCRCSTYCYCSKQSSTLMAKQYLSPDGSP